PRQRSLCRLLHDVTELSGERQTVRALHSGGLDEEQIASGRCPGEPGGHAGNPRPLLEFLVLEAWDPEVRGQRIRGDRRWRGVALGAPARDLPADTADLALEVADARFARVATNEEAQRLRRERHVGADRHAMLARLARQQMPLRDPHFLLLGVTGEM